MQKPLASLLTAAGLLFVLIQSASADFGPGQRVPAGTATGQTIHWSASANNGFGGWTVDGAFSTNGTQIGIGTAPTTTDRVSVNPSGTGENGLTITLPSSSTASALTLNSSAATLLAVTAAGHLIAGGASATVTVGANAASVTITGTDTCGRINAVTKSSGLTSATSLVHVFFATAYATTPKCVLVSPASLNAELCGVYVINYSTAGFDILSNAAPTASQNVTVMYLVIQ